MVMVCVCVSAESVCLLGLIIVGGKWVCLFVGRVKYVKVIQCGVVIII